MSRVLVAGGTSGIGNAICQRLTQMGLAVTAIGRRTDRLIPVTGVTVRSVDLSDSDDLDGRINALVDSERDVSSLVLSAGVGRFGSLEEFSSVQIRELIHVNLVSQMLLVRQFLPQLREHDQGHIVFIGSESALRGGRQGAVYSASKFALRGFAQALRLEVANRNLGVSIVNPGMVRTPFFDAQRFEPGEAPHHAIEAGDVADAVAMIFNMRPGTVVDEINLSPRQHVVQSKKPAV